MKHHRGMGVALLGLAMGCGTSPEFVDDPVDHPAAPSHDADAPAQGSVLGRWSGVGYQSSGSSWEMVLDVAHTDEGPCAVVRYPDVGCAGYWTCTGSSDGTRLKAVERITTGKKHCIDRVDVSVKLVSRGRRLAFAAQADDQTAEATLSPVD